MAAVVLCHDMIHEAGSGCCHVMGTYSSSRHIETSPDTHYTQLLPLAVAAVTASSCLHTFALSLFSAVPEKSCRIIVKCEAERRKERGEVLPGNITLEQYSTVQCRRGVAG